MNGLISLASRWGTHTLKHFMLPFPLFFLYIATVFSQGGPAGVGNSAGSNGQPQLNLWLDAADADLTGTQVLQLNDLSGNNYHAFQNTDSYRPLQFPGTLNERPVIRFNGTSMLETPGMPFNPGSLSYLGVSKSEHTGTDRGTLMHSLAWLGGWEYRRLITIEGKPGAGNDYTVKLTIGQSGDVTDFDFHLDNLAAPFPDDFRFTHTDGETLLDFWVEEVTGTVPNQTATVWVKIPGNLDMNQDIYLYYGNSSASPAGNPFNTFLFYDDFNRPDVDDITVEDAYTQTNGGSWAIADNKLRNVGADGDPNKLLLAELGPVNYPVLMKTHISIQTFASVDASRVGLSQCMEANGQGYAALFRNFNGRFRFLNDLRSWGGNTLSNPNWNLNTWYNLEFYITNPADRNGWVRFWEVNTPATAFENLNFGNGNARNWGYIGFAGSRRADISWFDDIIVRKYITDEPAFLSADPTETISSVSSSKFLHQYEGINFSTSHTHAGSTEQITGTGSAGFHINGVISQATGGEIYLNGAQTGSATWTDVNFPTFAQYNIGRNGLSGTEGLVGDIAELMVFNHDLNQAQRIIIENYLSAKYDVTLTSGKYYHHTTFTEDLTGIGITTGHHKHTATSGNGSALYLAASGNSLDDKTHTFLMAAHDATAHGTTSDDIEPLSGATQRWTRSWYLEKTGAVPFDVLLGFHFPEASQTLLPNQIYTLLFRETEAQEFTTIPGGLTTGEDDFVWFEIAAEDFQNGYYTIAPIENRVWYAYAEGIFGDAGYWDQPGSWTLAADGTWINPENRTPETSLTSHLDLVVIPQGKSIVVRDNGYANPVLDVREGTLDFQQTSGHQFNTITGSGKIRFQGDNFPEGNATAFNGATGGTVEFYGNNEILLTTPRTFNHMAVDMANPATEVIIATDYTLNGNLTIRKGTLQLNNDEHPEPVSDIRRTLIIKKDLAIQKEGHFRVGLANTNNSALDLGNQGGPYVLAGNTGLAAGSKIPTDYNFHYIYHQIEIWGNFSNRGTAFFTNQSQPVYSQINGHGGVTNGQTGSAVVWFKGATDNLMDLYGTTDFYHLIIDKGTNRDKILTIQSENEAYFRLFGSNILRGAGGGPNPEIRKALWIKTGTLRLKENIHIPTLTEGRDGTNSPNADFYIPANGGLWIDGATVYGTADNAAETIVGGVQGIMLSNSNGDYQGNIQSTSFYGDFRITSGLYSTRRSGGLIVWAQGDPVVRIEGGTLDAAQFRSAGNSTQNNRITLQITGGTINLRGNINGTAMEGGKGTFSMLGDHNVFLMEDGLIQVWDGIGTGGAFELNIHPANININGGTVQIMMDKGRALAFRNNYFINTRAPLWNLKLLTTGTTSVTPEPVRLYRDLTIQNNLLVGDQIPFRAGRNNTDGPFYDLHIGGDFILGETSTSTAQYYPSSDDGTLGNTTRFFGNNLSRITVASSSPATHINFHRLLLDKFGEDTLQIVSPGRPSANITNHPAQHSPLNITNALLIHRGLLDYNLFMIRLNDDVQLQNFGAIGRMDDMNGYLALEYPGISVELPDNREAQFGRVLVADDTEFSGAVNFLVGDLYMENGVVRIGSSGMKVKGDIFNSGPVDFSTGKLILTSGNHSDRGILQNIMAETNYHFPLGIDTKTGEGIRYTPTYMTISGLTTADGWVQVNNVDNELSTLNEAQPGEQALQYYWRIRHEGFDASQMPVVQNIFVFHNTPASYLPHPDDEELTNGKVVNYQRKHTLGPLEWDEPLKQLDLVFAFKETNGPEPSPLESGEFTAAHINRFSGALQVFYTYRKTDNDPPDESKPWNHYQAWSMAGHEDYLNPEQLIPGAGDVVFIGYDSNNNWHRVETQNNLQLAEVVFNYDEAFPRPRLTIGKDHSVTLNIVRGVGELEALVDSENIPQINGDLGEYISENNSSFLYNAGSTGLVTGTVLLPATPSVFPELKIEASSVKESGGDAPHFGDFIFTFPENITVRGDMHVREGAVYRTHDGTGGDIHVRGNLNLAGLRQSEFRFNGSGSSRSLKVDGNILLAPTGDPAEQLAFINVESGPADLNHYLYLGGDLIMQSGQDVRLNLGTANVRVELHLVGENNGQFVSASTSNPVFGRIIMNKGSNQQPSFSFNSNFTLTGATNGANKAIELRNGTLILNDSQINLDLTTGGADFSIPPAAALIVSDGRVNATGNNTGIYLAGLLRLENHAQAHFYTNGPNTNNTYIYYSSGGTAQLQVLNYASLTVGSQIRGNTGGSQETGILKYLQTGGEVIVGRNTIPNNSRAAFEVFNPGSEFIMEAGDLYIARNQANAYRAALFLHPDIYQMGNSARIFVGHPTLTPGSNTIRVNSAPALSNLIVEGSSTTLLNENTPLTVEKLLHIKAGNQLNMNEETLILRGNLLNEGSQAELHDSKTIVEGTDSDIYGEVWFNKLQVNLQGQLQLHNDITVLDSLILLNGNIRDEGNAMFVQGHIINHATHISGAGKSVGGLILNGASHQEISGSGEYGNVELLNNEGARLKSNMRMSGNLRLGAGILQLQNHRLSLGLQSVVEGAPFSTSKMITTSGGIEARGLEKRLDAGQDHFLFPIGIAGKYTPVELVEYTVADNSGRIAFAGVNEQHSSTIDYLEDGETGAVNRVLQYHWTSQTSNLAGFNASLWFTYDKDDLPVDDYEPYLSAMLLDAYWTKLEGEDMLDEENNRFNFTENVSDIPIGFYTFGHRHNIPAKVPTYRTTAPGNWNDISIWEKTQPDMPDLQQDNGPFGNIVYIEHEVTIPHNDQRSYITHIESGGQLNIGTTTQHRLGEVRGNGTFTINRGLLPAGKFDAFFNSPGSTIIYGGSDSYTLTDRYVTVQNIVFRGDGQITLPNKPILISGNLLLEESALVITDADIYLQGNLIKNNDATFAMGHNVIFVGTTPQIITGSFIQTSAFENLSSGNTIGGLALASGTEAEVRNQLSLFDGARIFTSFENNLILNNQNPYGTIHPESFVSGPLQRHISNNSATNRFIIGDNDIRRDLYLLNPLHGGGMQYWQAEYFHSNPITDIGDGFQYPPFNSIQEQEYWKITPPAASNPQSRIGLTYGPETGIEDDLPGFEENIAIAFFEGQWLPVGDPPYTYHVEQDSNMVSSEGMVMFYSKSNEKYFTFGSKSPTMPLPVELLYFTAEAREKGIILQWATASETGNDFFTIERSLDGKSFEPKGIVESQAGNGNSNRLLVYEFSDLQPLPGVSYYRLKQTDLDGNYTYSPLVGVNFQIIADIELKLFPNPNSGNSFRLAINGLNSHEAVDIHIHDLYGRLNFADIKHSDDNGSLQAYIVPGGRLPAGVYMVTISGLSGRMALRMVVQ